MITGPPGQKGLFVDTVCRLVETPFWRSLSFVSQMTANDTMVPFQFCHRLLVQLYTTIAKVQRRDSSSSEPRQGDSDSLRTKDLLLEGVQLMLSELERDQPALLPFVPLLAPFFDSYDVIARQDNSVTMQLNPTQKSKKIVEIMAAVRSLAFGC